MVGTHDAKIYQTLMKISFSSCKTTLASLGKRVYGDKMVPVVRKFIHFKQFNGIAVLTLGTGNIDADEGQLPFR